MGTTGIKNVLDYIGCLLEAPKCVDGVTGEGDRLMSLTGLLYGHNSQQFLAVSADRAVLNQIIRVKDKMIGSAWGCKRLNIM